MRDKTVDVSIIVPVYNVEKYLRKCVDSILSQSYSDFELLLIDDGSTDSSGVICDEYIQVDSRVHVFHKANGGLSDARNYGIERAKGSYLTFIDSDDYIGKEYLAILVGLVKKYHVQISCVSAVSVLEQEKIFSSKTGSEGYLNTEQALRNMCIRRHFGVAAWGKLYRKELFSDIRYPKGRVYEDLFTTPYVIALADSVAYNDSKQYFWVLRKGSITHTSASKRELKLHLDGLEKLIDYIDTHYPKIYDAAICRYVIDTFWLIVHKMVYSDRYNESIKYIIKHSAVYWRKGLRNPYVGKKKKIEIILIMISPRLYQKMYLVWNRIRYFINLCFLKKGIYE